MRKSTLFLTILALILSLAIPDNPAKPANEAPAVQNVAIKLVQPLSEPSIAPISTLSQVAVETAPAASTSVCGDNSYANYIYMHESGCSTSAVNSIGACGIGQALPCSKMGCSLDDYACQNGFFTSYANAVYGGWYGAYEHWLEYSWW